MFFFLALPLISCVGIKKEHFLFSPREHNVRYYRIPGITTAKDGSLVAACDARHTKKNDLPSDISVYVRRSTDKAQTWEPFQCISGKLSPRGDGDPSIVTDRKTGTILCLWNGNNGFSGSSPKNPLRHYYSRSYDNGATWTEKVDFTDQVYSNLCTTCDDRRKNKFLGMFLSSGYCCQLRNGRIMVAGVTRVQGQGAYGLYAVSTDDLGETWHVGKNSAYNAADESKYVENNKGDVIVSIRSSPNRIFAYSHDEGETWDGAKRMPDIHDSPCNAEIHRYTSVLDGYDKNRMLHTAVYHVGLPRQNLTILVSYDEGKTWPVKKVIDSDWASYSSIAIGHDGKIFVYYEKGINHKDPDDINMTVVEMDLDWVTDGKDTYKKPTEINWCFYDQSKPEDKKKCPASSYAFSEKVFDSYIESYWEYPARMQYTFHTDVRDFTINTSIPGNKYLFINNTVSHIPTMKVVGTIDQSKLYELENMRVLVPFESITTLGSMSLNNVILRIDNGNINKVEIGKTKIRVTTNSSLKSVKSYIYDVSMFASVEIYNNQTGIPFIVTNGISGVAGQDKAEVVMSIIVAANQSLTKVEGTWDENEGKHLSITVESDVVDPKVEIDSSASGNVNIDGIANVEVTNSRQKGLNLSTTLIIVIVVIVIVVILAITIGAVICIKKKKRAPSESESFTMNFEM